jgi:competence protein ComEC
VTQNTAVGGALAAVLALTTATGCSTALPGDSSGATVTPATRSVEPSSVPPPATLGCHEGKALTVHFYDVGQALAALVDLPDGRHLLVDAGEAHGHLASDLRRDLAGAPIDLAWTTHPHSDHVGGMAEILRELPVLAYVDNGRGSDKAEVRAAREAAARRHVPYAVIDPEHASLANLPVASSPTLTVRPIVPPAWPASCAHDENECSIGLRVDFCGSSVLFTGDAEREEEGELDPLGPATLLQVGHHGSDTSTSARFLARVQPRYAVVSAGHPDDERNREYCHPRALAMRRLSHALTANGTGGGGEHAHLEAYEGSCTPERSKRASGWVDVPVSGRLFATERDGDVVLTTTGEGRFSRR